MTFSFYALLGKSSPQISNDSLAINLQEYFRNEEFFSLEFETLPFAATQTLFLHFGEWGARVCYEEGQDITGDSVEIGRIVASSAPWDLAQADRRIRVVCGDDPNKTHTNQMIYLMEFLNEIPGAVIFDPQRNDLLTLG